MLATTTLLASPYVHASWLRHQVEPEPVIEKSSLELQWITGEVGAASGAPVDRAAPASVGIHSTAGSWSPDDGDRGWLDLNTVPTAGRGFAVMLLEHSLSLDDRKALLALDVALIASYPPNAILVRLEPGNSAVLTELGSFPSIRWVGPMPAQLKIHPRVSRAVQNDLDAEVDEDTRLLRVGLVQFNQDERDALGRHLDRLGFGVVAEDSISLWLNGQLDQVAELAALDSILFIEAGWVRPNLHHRNSMPLIYADRVRVAFDSLPEGGTGTRVGIIDGDYNEDHEALPPLMGSQSFVAGCSSSLANPFAENIGHGSHVAGTMLGRGENEWSMLRGVAPRVQDVWFAQAFDPSGEPGDAVAAMEWMAEEADVDVVNNSWGCCSDEEEPQLTCLFNEMNSGTGFDAVVADRLTYETGITWVFSAGNSGWCSDDEGLPSPSLSTPADAKSVISVGSSRDWGTSADTRSWFSSVGPTADNRNKPDLLAPGEQITSASGNDNDAYISYEGTSQAAPHVAGAVALLQEAVPEIRRRPDAIKALLRGSAIPTSPLGTPDALSGAGRLELWKLIGQRDQSDGWLKSLALGESLQEGESSFFEIEVPQDSERLGAVLSWIEPEGTPGSYFATHNNLDLLLWAPDGELVYSISDTDSVETVIVDNPVPGTWTIEVEAWWLLAPVESPEQDFALALVVDRGSPRGTPETTVHCNPSTVPVGGTTSCTVMVTSQSGISPAVHVHRGPGVGWRVGAYQWWLRDGSLESSAPEQRLQFLGLGDIAPSDQRSVIVDVEVTQPGEHELRFVARSVQDATEESETWNPTISIGSYTVTAE